MGTTEDHTGHAWKHACEAFSNAWPLEGWAWQELQPVALANAYSLRHICRAQAKKFAVLPTLAGGSNGHQFDTCKKLIESSEGKACSVGITKLTVEVTVFATIFVTAIRTKES